MKSASAMRGIPLIALVASSLLGCATSVKLMTIEDLELSAWGAPPGFLVPGNSYELKLRVMAAGRDRPIKNPDWSEIELSSPDGSLSPGGRWNNVLDVPYFGLKRIGGAYAISAKVKGNKYEGNTFRFEPLWKLCDGFRKKGRDGDSGSSGENGGNGDNGPAMDVEAAYYDVSGTDLEGSGRYILVHLVGTDAVSLVSEDYAPFTIASIGGVGGSGGEGSAKFLGERDEVVYGGNGAAGGNGGNGGFIRFYAPYADRDVSSLFVFDTAGGAGGSGGSGGRGDSRKKNGGVVGVLDAAFGVNRGDSGSSGRPGMNGRYEVTRWGLDSMFLGIRDPDFDRGRLRSD